jgi:RNA polymerase sigma-70 factor (ECF subfamily)
MVEISEERALWVADHVLPHEPVLRAWLRRRRVPEADIDDLVHDTYAKLFALESFSNIRDPKSYTFQAAWSIYVSRVRRAQIVSIRTIANFDQLAVEAPGPSPERQLQDREELELLAAALAALPVKCREAFILRRVEGLSQREVAEKLGISEKTVEKHMARGIRHLMDIFGRGGKQGVQASIGEPELSRQRHVRENAEPGD